MLYRPQKKKVLENSKISTFCEGVSHCFFGKNSTFFFYVFFKQTSKKETYFDILDSKECFSDLKSETLAKSKKSAFCKGVSP